jgi:ATP-dependent RNA helicase DDX18/HAS1
MSTNKMMVFFSTCKSVEFHYGLFQILLREKHKGQRIYRIHGKMMQPQRSRAFREFSSSKNAILLCTDVAARGLDIPEVDWIVQYDPPDDPAEYIHRVGRTARGTSAKGSALLMLRPEEIRFLDFLRNKKVNLTDHGKDWEKVTNIDSDLQTKIDKIANNELYQQADDAFTAYMRAYGGHQLKAVFNKHSLYHKQVAVSFGCG